MARTKIAALDNILGVRDERIAELENELDAMRNPLPGVIASCSGA